MTRISAGITVALLALPLHPGVRAAAPEPSVPPAPPLSIIVKLRPASASRGGEGLFSTATRSPLSGPFTRDASGPGRREG